MKESEIKKGASFFYELALRLRRENIGAGQPENDRLPILLDGQEVGVVAPGGSMRIRKECIDEPDASDLYHRVGEIAAEVQEYMTLMDNVPSLNASSLNAPYKLLTDFNGYVLGGMGSKHGVQFTTWQWTYGKDGLTLGHYCGNDYAAAKRDFAIRAGLVPEEKQFTPEQLIEIYRCCADTIQRDYDLTYEQEKCIEEIQSQITELLPDYGERLKAALEQNASQQPTM